MPPEEPTATIAHVIQLAVAPVFMLSGIAALLNVLINRLNRLVDRARSLEAQFPGAPPGRAETLRESLQRLALRTRLVSWAISLSTASAVLIGTVVIVLFVGALMEANIRVPIATLFITAMVALTTGLIAFLREIYLATRYLRIGVPEPEQESESVVTATTPPTPKVGG
jgi:hypothetical protein